MRGITWVSLFEAYNLVLARGLDQVYKKIMKRMVRRTLLINIGGGNGLFLNLKITSPINVLGALYQKLPNVLKDTRFGKN